MRSLDNHAVISSIFYVFAVCATPALAQTGASDDRVNLPDGPGSRDGIGDSAALDDNMGLMTHAVSFEVPRGHAALKPQLGLSYSSGGGASVAGIGWLFDVPAIERYTARGLPGYDADDRISAGPSQELVRVARSGDLAFYRARFEGGFVRYAWHDVGGGSDGYWTAEAPDGTVSYYGADKDGVTATDARLAGAEGTFRWLIKESVDVWGHRVVYSYNRLGGAVPLLQAVEYAFADDDAATGPQARVAFRYEVRPDLMSDARSGFEELTAHRLVGVDVFSAGDRVRGYELAYEDFDTAGGLSRLASVTPTGKDGVSDPVRHAFRYSQGLGGSCSGESCAEPQLTQMGSLGVDLRNGTATLIDLNGDGVPDLLEAAAGQSHRIHLSALDEDGRHTWRAPVTSALTGTSAHALTSPFVQPLDVDGDGFVDLLNAQSGEVLKNRGAGDWSAIEAVTGDTSVLLNELSTDLGKIRFLDADLDRRIDALRADATGTTLYRNLGDAGFVADDTVDDIEAGFQEDNLQLADMNGDGLLDPVKLLIGEVQFRVNLGRGQFSAFRTIENAPITSEDLAFTSLEDLNGDGIDDIVIVSADQVRYALNRNAASFEEVATISDAGGAALPNRDATTTVLFADMNANGSDDVVWINASGSTTYLELFPVRPNLITHIDNGIGMNIDVTYVSSALVRARNPLAWQHATPSPMLVVDTRDVYADLDVAGLEQHDVRQYAYENAYYDTVEKAFRGYEVVNARSLGDDNQEELTTRSIFDLGLTSPARAGRLLVKEWYSETARLRRDETDYDDCAVALVPAGLPVPVEFVCPTATTTSFEEGAAEAAFVTIRSSFEYDGFGNRIVTRDDGVIGTGRDGASPCEACGDRDAGVGGAPCGAQCLGDEFVVEQAYVAPPASATAVGGWLLQLPSERRTSTGLGRTRIERDYYDGADFIGLPLGSATRGAVTRQETLLDESGSEALQTSRHRRDAHGNIVELLQPNGDLDSADHRQLAFYDALGLDLLAEERTVARATTGGEELLRLRREFTYDDVFDAATTTTDWFLADRPASRAVTRFVFDALGRPVALVRPGDSLATPTTELAYEHGPVFSRVIKRTRSVSGAAEADIVEVECTDGLGRPLLDKSRLDDTHWLSSGVKVLNGRGQVVVESDLFTAADDRCTAEVPDGVRISRATFDALGRSRDVIENDGDERGTPSVTRRTYGPMTVIEHDQQSVAADGPPTSVARFDGQGRLVRVARGDGDDATFVDVDYDDLGELRGYRDALGNRRVQERDLASRIVSSSDPDRGVTRYELDDEGNPVKETQANGRVTRRAYDALSRKIAEWDDADEAATKMTYIYDRHPDCPGQSCDNGAARLVGHTYPLGEFGGGVDFWGYDERGQPIEATRELLGVTFRMEARFDAADRVIEQTWPGGRAIGISYDALGRAAGIDGVVSDITYDPRGPMASMRTSNGVNHTFAHDARLRLTSIAASSPAGAILDLALTRDRLGNITAVDDAVGGSASSSARFQYDELSRLTEAVLDPSGTNETVAWRFDAIERLVEKTASIAGAPAGSVDDIGDIVYAGATNSATFAGRDIGRDAAGLATTVGDLALAYDHRNRIVEVQRDGDDVARSFYTGSGYRVMKVVGGAVELSPFPDYEVRDGVSRLLVPIDGAPVMEEETAPFATALFPDGNDDGAITAADAWLARGQDVSRTMLRSAARRLLFDDGDDDFDSARAFLHSDHTGSTVAVSDASGVVKERLAYRPYGSLLATTAGASEYARYAGHDVDEETGFISFGLRSLDPVLGAFLTPDPAGAVLVDESGITNAATPYNYARSNPLSFSDEGGAFPLAFATKAGWALRVAGWGAVLGSATIAIVAVATGAGTMGIGNVVGAVIGGVVAAGFEIAAQRAAAGKLYPNATQGELWKKTFSLKGIGKIAWATFKGVVGGTMSMGLSATFTASNGLINVAQARGLSAGAANALRAVVAVASIATSGTLYGVENQEFGNYGSLDVPGLAVDTTQNTLESVSDIVLGAAEKEQVRRAGRFRPRVAAAARPLVVRAPSRVAVASRRRSIP